MAIDVLIVDLIPANPIELFGNRAKANTNRSGEEFNYRTQTNTNHRLSWILLVDYFTLLYSTLLYSTLPYSTLLYSTLLYPALPYPTLRYHVQ